MDNYRVAKRKAGELMMHMILDDIGQMDDYEVETDVKSDGKRRTIILNSRQAHGGRDNDVLMAKMRVALADEPSSVTYQQQKFQSLVEIVKSMPEQMQVVMMDLVVRAASLPDADEMLERIREMTGYGPEPKDPEKAKALQESKARQEEMQQKMQQIEMMLQEAEARLKAAQAIEAEAKAEKIEGVDSELTEAKTLAELAKAEFAQDEQDRKARETSARMVEASARLEKEANADAAAKAKPAAD